MTVETGSPINTAQAASKISSLLNPKAENEQPGAEQQQGQPKKKNSKNQPAPKKEAKKPQQEAPDADPVEDADDGLAEGADDAEGDDPLLDDADDQADDADDQDAQSSDEEEQGADEADDAEHVVVIDGEEIKVSYEELINGYQRQADYSRRMNALAKERKELEAVKEQTKDLPQVQKRYEQGAERFVQNAQLVLTALEQRFMPKAPSAELAKTDPGTFLQQKEIYQEALQFRQGIIQELSRVDAEGKQQQQKLIQEGRQKLFVIQPELKDPAARQKLRAYAKSHGFSDENIASEPNPILFDWAWKAMKYDEIMKRKAELSATKSPPKTMKQSKATADHKALKNRKRTEALGTHRQTGNVNSAAAAISALIKK